MTRRPTDRCRTTSIATTANVMILNVVLLFFMVASAVVTVG